ncbi:stage V sporulation protein R [Desulfosarcina sp. BuS5]|uniref:SpoVR family protein n=1 Tax=Desulfosarcina sp. BuS5 TaxID=933262 RepID=UPI0004886914|nr:SpoVR family protein [Desulfosarcina sp. BuS5]WDN90842.1 stage V sporulation protein R [Desulfosarcina sp. BuS5]
MELIDQHTKKIMEGCKERARDAGLKFQDETLEYIVTNRDLLELSPKIMIPTLYDYWVHDVEVLKEKGKYELYPGNPYETVINTRPAISFYNDNNPDWLNVMIFYHVLAHIDFFQNNLFYRHTWDYDFAGQALSDKRLIAKLRSEHGRWVDYVIEFSRGIDNLAGYYYELSRLNRKENAGWSNQIDFYFDVFIQKINKLSVHEYIKEIERYNECLKESGDLGEETFMAEIDSQHPEFKELFRKSLEEKPKSKQDLIQYLMEHSEFLNKEKNKWMNSVLQVVRNTSIFFQPQIRTKIMNEGWASYWHETLFLSDDRIGGHEVDFARLNAGVTSMPRVGLNPYALGMRLFYYIEEIADKGKLSFEFQKVANAEERKTFDRSTKNGRSFIFSVRENYSDFMFINKFLDQDFATRNRLFVAGRRLNRAKKVYEYYIKSRKLEDYRAMVLDSLYHPPQIEIDTEKMKDNSLYLTHTFENKPLVKEFISNTMVGIEYLWGSPVHLETHEVVAARSVPSQDLTLLGPTPTGDETAAPGIKWQKVLYSMKNRKLTRKIL